MNRITRILAALVVIVIAAPAIAQVTDEAVDSARAEVNEIVSESQDLGEAVQEAWSRQYELEYEISQLKVSIDFAQIQLTETEQRLEEVAVELYMGSTSVASLAVLFNATGDDYEAGLEYLREVSGVDDDVINQLRVFRRELDRQSERFTEASAEQVIVTAELEELAIKLQDELVAAQSVYDDLVEQQRIEEEERLRKEEEERLRKQEEERLRKQEEERLRKQEEERLRKQEEERLRKQEEERQRLAEEARRRAEEAARQATSTTSTTSAAPSTTIPTTTTSGGDISLTTTTVPPTTTTTTQPASSNGACPVAGAVSFTDSWGDPRSGGRTHQGVDLIAARGTPLVAVFSGTIKRISTSSLGGKSLWFRASNGDEFYYAHLDGFGAISVGQSVAEGYVVGYNGSSGNAPEWLPHLHFEFHPGGGVAVNPYPLVKSICG